MTIAKGSNLPKDVSFIWLRNFQETGRLENISYQSLLDRFINLVSGIGSSKGQQGGGDCPSWSQRKA